jgi:hypothetical protein
MGLRQMGIPVTLATAGGLWLMFKACLISLRVILIEVLRERLVSSLVNG